jgi:hypothetical protein
MEGVVMPTEGADRGERTAVRLYRVAACRLRNWWARAFGRGAAWDEGRDTALANAAMVAYDMGRPDIREAINRLIPVGSKYKPLDSHDDAYGGC